MGAAEATSEAVAEATDARLAALERQVHALDRQLRDAERRRGGERTTILIVSASLEAVTSALMIATSAAALGGEVVVYCAFWGVQLVRKRRAMAGKSWLERVLTAVMPGRIDGLRLQRMHFGGLGVAFITWLMRRKRVAGARDLLATAQAAGVRFVACPTSMDMFGVRQDELLDGVVVKGAASFVDEARDASLSLVF